MGRWYIEDFCVCWGDEEDEENPPTCPKCGEVVPESHLETDTGNCISCEDAAYEARRESEVYDLCLMGLQPRLRKKRK